MQNWFSVRPARDYLWGYTDSIMPVHFPGLQNNDTSFADAMARHSPTRVGTGATDSSQAWDYIEWDGGGDLWCCANGPRGESDAGDGCAPQWSSYDATSVRGSFGNSFHPFIDPSETLAIATYPFGILRHWPLVCDTSKASGAPAGLYDGGSLTAPIGGCDNYEVHGISLLKFRLPEWALGNASVDEDEADGYGIKGPSGILDVSPCEQNAPILLSKPHFLDGTDSLRTAVEGLTLGDPAIHGVFEPKLCCCSWYGPAIHGVFERDLCCCHWYGRGDLAALLRVI